MQNFAEIHLTQEARARYGLPDIAYPTPTDLISKVTAGGSELPLAVFLHCLQVRSRYAGKDWQQYEAAMDQLSTLIAPNEQREVVNLSN
jgi:hypothetical protein